MRFLLRPLTVWLQYWPQLAACYLLGLLGRHGAIMLAARVGYDNDFWASVIMPLAGMARLGSYVAMFLVLRRAFPELAALPTRAVRHVDLFATVIVPFFAIYLAWQMFKEDWLLFEANALPLRAEHAMNTAGPTDLHPEVLPVGVATWVLIVAALVSRFILNRVKDRLPGWMVGVRIYVDALWVFLVLTFSVNQGLTILINPTKWIAQRRIIVWFNDIRIEAFSHVRFLETVWDAAAWTVKTAFGSAAVPLIWLAIAGIVYGVSATGDWRGAARRVAGSRAERLYERAAPTGKRLQGRWAKLPKSLVDKTREYVESQLGKFKPVVDSARLISHAGVLALSLYVLAYVALAWLDMSGGFYGNQLVSGYLYRGMAWLLGPHPQAFWTGFGDTLSVISHVIIEPLRICLIATTLAFCLHHVQTATPPSAPEVVPQSS